MLFIKIYLVIGCLFFLLFDFPFIIKFKNYKDDPLHTMVISTLFKLFTSVFLWPVRIIVTVVLVSHNFHGF